MNGKEPTWFVRLQGHTLGPLSMDELRKSVREGEICPEDKLNRAGEFGWRRLSEFPELLQYWESLQRPVFAIDLPSPQLLWKKTRAETPAPEPVPAVIPETPDIPVAAAAKSEPKPKKAKQAAPKKRATKKAPAPAHTAAENPIEIAEPLPQIEPVAQPVLKAPAIESIVQLLDPAALKINTDSLFPARPEVPKVEQEFRPQRRVDEFREFREFAPKRQKLWQALAVAGLVLIVAAVAYYAGQKTRDLKELPLSDPSSPTTQLPAAGDPILPLRAPTRPQRD